MVPRVANTRSVRPGASRTTLPGENHTDVIVVPPGEDGSSTSQGSDMRTSPSRAAILAARSLHLVDIENLVGDPRADAETVLATFDRYLAAARWKPGDHVVVAANPGLMQKVAFDLPVPANM